MIVFPQQIKRQLAEIKQSQFFPTLERLRGTILEVGYGKGENFRHYNKACSVYAIDKKIDRNPFDENKLIKCNLTIGEGSIEKMLYPDNFFDVVVASFVLCSVDSEEKAIAEIYRVLKPGGRLILLEHIKSNQKISHSIQKAVTYVQGIFSIDCHLDRDPRPILQKSNFKTSKMKIFSNSLEPYLYLEAFKS